MHDCQARGVFLVFLQDDEGGVVAVVGEGGDFADGVVVAVVVTVLGGGAGDVDTVGEEGC